MIEVKDTKINKFRGEYFFLSNYFEAPVLYDGILYNSSEAAYHAQKCENPEDRQLFIGIDADASKKLGRKVKMRKDWDDVKFGIMHDIVLAKFQQNKELAAKLLATGTAYLEEGNTWGDKIWGTVNGEGENHLGVTLMIVRNEIKYQHKFERAFNLKQAIELFPKVTTESNNVANSEDVRKLLKDVSTLLERLIVEDK